MAPMAPRSLLSSGLVPVQYSQIATPDSGLPMPNTKSLTLNPSGDTPPRQISSQGNSDNITGSDIILASRSTVTKLVLILQPFLVRLFSTLECENQPRGCRKEQKGRAQVTPARIRPVCCHDHSLTCSEVVGGRVVHHSSFHSCVDHVSIVQM